ncbi:STAS domain-containing protein [Mycobacterium sp.]|uniref:STAS domain-containing protein n=1 Tax=Mycobacterium sp. TaxID=1785 RepID=UPI003D6A7F85
MGGYPIRTSVEHRDGVTVLVVGGEIDMASAPTLESAVAGVLAEDALALVIDLSEVRFLASVGLSILVAAREKIGEPGRFAVAAQGPLISRIIQLVNLDELLSLHETLEDALLAVTGSKPGSDATPTA